MNMLILSSVTALLGVKIEIKLECVIKQTPVDFYVTSVSFMVGTWCWR